MVKNYLNNKDLYYEIIISKGKGKLTDKASKMLGLLGSRVIKKFFYSNTEDMSDCYHSGMLDIYMRWQNFNPEISDNAFAYFTEIFKRGCAKQFNVLTHKNNYDVKMITTSFIDKDGSYINI